MRRACSAIVLLIVAGSIVAGQPPSHARTLFASRHRGSKRL